MTTFTSDYCQGGEILLHNLDLKYYKEVEIFLYLKLRMRIKELILFVLGYLMVLRNFSCRVVFIEY